MTVRTVLGALSAASVLVVGGCGSEPLAYEAHPGAAAVVGDERIEVAEVDSLAREYCDFAVPEEGGESYPMSLLRNISLDVLVNRAIAQQYAEAHDLDLADARRLLRQQAEQRAIQERVPVADRDTYYEVVIGLDAQSIYLAAGGRESFERGELPETDAVTKGAEAVRAWAEDVEVVYDPRFADLRGGEYAVDAASLATPASRLATLAADYQPGGQVDPEHLDALPASQKCG